MRRLLCGQIFARPEQLSPDQAYANVVTLVDGAGFHAVLDALADFRFAGPVRVPVTIAWGTRDGLLLPSQALRARRVLPEARHLWLRGCGHVPMSDDPAQVAAVLLSGSATGSPPRSCGGAVERRALKGSAAGAGRPPAATPGPTWGDFGVAIRPQRAPRRLEPVPAPRRRTWGALAALCAVVAPHARSGPPLNAAVDGRPVRNAAAGGR